MKRFVAILASIATLVLCFAAPAEAGLFGAGRTVQAFYYTGTFASPEGEIPVGAQNSDPAPLAAPVFYSQGPEDGSTISFENTTISITNLVTAPFCSADLVGTACTDAIDGFDFLFTGENILGVSVNPASAADMLPVSGTFQGHTHLGLQVVSNNEIRVDLTGDAPLLNDTLILDLTFAVTPPPTVPEPATLALLGLGLSGLAIMRRRKSN